MARRGRPGPILQHAAVGEDDELRAVPVEPDRAGLGEPPFVEQSRRPAGGRRRQRTDDDRRARAILFERGAVEHEAQRLPLGEVADAPEPVASGIGDARAGGIAVVAVGGEPLLGGERIVALAEQHEAAVGVAQRHLVGRRRHDDVVTRAEKAADNAKRKKRERASRAKIQLRQMTALATARLKNGSDQGAKARTCKVEPGAAAISRAANRMSLMPSPT